MDFSDYVQRYMSERAIQDPSSVMDEEGQSLLQASRDHQMDSQLSDAPGGLRGPQSDPDPEVESQQPIPQQPMPQQPSADVSAAADEPGSPAAEPQRLISAGSSPEAVPEQLREMRGPEAAPEQKHEERFFLESPVNHKTVTEQVFVPNDMQAQFNEIVSLVDREMVAHGGDMVGFAEPGIELPPLPEIPPEFYRSATDAALDRISNQMQQWGRL
jgi:hypothetical protein